jgi:tetratricopeptide (TPR) repeat protein
MAKITEQKNKLLHGGYPLLWITILGMLLYGQSIGFGYSYLDDTNLILNQLNNLGQLSYIPQAFKEDVFHSPGGQGYYYRPILTVSFVLDAVVGNGSLAMFRFSNILFHILATWLLFLCLAALKYDRIKSFLISLLFLVHPLLTQAVAWVPGRNDILLAVFIFGAFYAFIRYLETRKWQHLLVHTALWFLALLTKETALILPFLLFPAALLIFHAPFRKIAAPSSIWALLALVWFAIRASVLGGTPYQASDYISSLLRNLPAVIPFLGKSFFPVGLSVFPVFSDMTLSTILGIVAIMLMVFLLIISKPRRWVFFLFGIAWFLMFLVPTFIKHTTTADLTEHRGYLPLAGILIFLIESGPVKNLDLGRRISRISAGVLILLSAALTVIHLQSFKDRFAFWHNAVETSPSHAYNYNTLGAMYLLDNDLDQGYKYISKSLSINPDEPQANSNFGMINMRKGNLDEAEKFYKKEIAVNPLFDIVHYNYGILLYNQGKTDSALLMWEKTIEINPAYADAYQALMEVYRSQGKVDDYNRIGYLAVKNGVASQKNSE